MRIDSLTHELKGCGSPPSRKGAMKGKLVARFTRKYAVTDRRMLRPEILSTSFRVHAASMLHGSLVMSTLEVQVTDRRGPCTSKIGCHQPLIVVPRTSIDVEA